MVKGLEDIEVSQPEELWLKKVYEKMSAGEEIPGLEKLGVPALS